MELWLKDLGVWNSVVGYPEGDITSEEDKKKHDTKAMTKIGLMVKPCCYPHINFAKTAGKSGKT
jgi:hypothetical protein